MSISASHWAAVCSNVRAHANKLHPFDKKAARKLEHHLLAIVSKEDLEDMHEKSEKITSGWDRRLRRCNEGTTVSMWFWKLWYGYL